MARMDSIDNYQVLNLVGKGGFASVYKAKRVSTGQEVAIKMVDKQQMMASGMAERVKQEVEIHSRLNHPAILEVLGYFEDNSHVYMVLELCENGELAKYLRDSNRVFSEQEARTIFEQVVSGLLYLHGHGIMHRDLTLANLLLTRDMRVKIADFGLATRLTGRPNERHVTMCGTPNYISPEVATRSSHGLEADVWGLGCLLYTMLVGKPPFDTAGVRSTLTRVVMADFLLPPHLTPEAQDLISQLLRKNPTERLRLKELAGHPWMSRPQDSGMYTMTTTAFSAVSGQRAPGPRPLPAYPALTEYSAEMGSQHSAPRSTTPYSAPHLLHPSSPPVKMVTPAQDLPAPLLPHYRGAPPQTSLYSRQFSLPDTGARAPMAALPPREVSMRSVHSDPSLHHHHQRPTEFLQQPAPLSPPSQPPSTGGPGVPPLSSTRLRPTRQKTKNAVANISPSGEVCLEFLKVRQGEERVVDVMRISGDGQRVVVYTPGPSKAEGAPVLASPAPIPSRGADAFYSYQSLPDKYWKKYQYAERFVNLVKAKTPKMTLYTAQAKCYLMENSERDFEVFFYSGLKATLSGAGAGRAVKLIGGAGGSQTFGWPVRPESLAQDTRRNMEHFSSCLAHCTRLEAVLGTLDSAEQPVFPVVLGRKPQLLQGGDNSLEKENREPQVGGGMRDTLLSSHQRAPSVLGRPPASQRSLPSPGRDGHRKVAIEGVGEAVQLACGNVRVYYLDGSSLILRSATATVDYFLPSPGGGGAWCTYTSSDMPEGVRAKMAGIPRVLQCLLGEQGGRPASVR